ncbi:LOW QUALITY PROTEIN: hypothetical protein E2986_04406 [Frieseomelitta varia]|uniref:Uncharacterized protein n=1 Tax=Frieseomelitta varia TaxID=561572 RepID=A0A833RN64_9HYME|nr:LOW QUALITY PROTEIN: hypothetical protein E2986_04406 [Frieseomelitta varia]
MKIYSSNILTSLLTGTEQTSQRLPNSKSSSFLLACIIGTSGVVGIDCSIMTVILHVAGQFKLIKTWMNKIGTEINRESVHLEKFEIDLFKCIRHHQRIIHVVNDINNLFTPILFMQLLTSGIEICLSGYAMLGYRTAIIDVLKFIFYFISMMVEILLFCWPSEILVQESEEVGYVIYFNVPWYKLSPIHRRHLCLMIIRAQRYCSITALTFKTLSFQTLTSKINSCNTKTEIKVQMISGIQHSCFIFYFVTANASRPNFNEHIITVYDIKQK